MASNSTSLRSSITALEIQMKRHFILWDVDGTLVSNDDSDEALFVQMLEAVVGQRDHIVHPYRHGKTDLGQVTDYLLGNGAMAHDIPFGRQALIALSEKHFAEPGERTAMPGVRDAVNRLHAAGHAQAILTGNGRRRAELKLRSAGIKVDHFDLESSFFGEETLEREDLTRAAADHARERCWQPVIIGDTVADGHAAEKAGIPFIGVATGTYSEEDLRTTPHLLIVADVETGWAAIEGLLGT